MDDRLVVLGATVLGRFELPDSKVIPGRNATLALLASNYGDDILMGSVDSSTGHDKDGEFAYRLNNLFDWMYQRSRWLPNGRKIRLRLPVYDLTKTELVGQVLARGHDGDQLAGRTFSCYEPRRHSHPGSDWVEPCGQCGPCGRKWMAFTVYGVDVGYDGREALRPYINELEKVKDDNGTPPGRSKQFVLDLLDAWDGNKREVPPEIPFDRFGRAFPDRVVPI